MYQEKESKKKTGKIGVFDSGFGGLSILKEIVKKMPQYSYVYLGDSARAPYGSKSHEVILEFTKQGVDFLFGEGAEIVVLACNSASAQALRDIKGSYLPETYPEKKVLGVIIPTAEVAITKSKNKCIGVLATEATVSAGAFKRELKKLDSTVDVYEIPAPLLVPLIEAGKEDSLEIKRLVKDYVALVSKQPIDTLILGCTHYGIIKEDFISVAEGITVISEAEIVSDKFFTYIEKHADIKSKFSLDADVCFFTTDTTNKFESIGSRFFGSTIISHEINL